MKNISISTATYTAIWAARRDGEETEEQILSRLLGAEAGAAKPKSVPLPKPVPQKHKAVKPVQLAKPAPKPSAAPKEAGKYKTSDLDLLS
ncbi:MAG: hypothetical protein AAF441_13705 [Pseudomonadota bacterium]